MIRRTRSNTYMWLWYGEEVEEHKLSDGTHVLKGEDGILYDPESFDPIGTWNEEDNTLVKN